MINREIVKPNSIVVVGGSNDLSKPGGRVLNNLIKNNCSAELFVVNKHSETVQGIPTYPNESLLPAQVDLAILSIPAQACLASVQRLVRGKGTKSFIILSAGFGETGDTGKKLEKKIVTLINEVNGCLIGPNCIGVINSNYAGVFTLPIPPLSSSGCDLISSSGATAVFLMEAGIPLGIKFSNVFSLGNAAQTSVEDVLQYMDENFDPNKDSKIKLLYLESIKDPERFLKHSKSLIGKGVKIAAIKAGSTKEGSLAAASHTGALSSSDSVIRALFRKANIVYCSSRMELLSIASIFHYGDINGENFAVITHAGGSAVMLTDTLIEGGLHVPKIQSAESEKLLSFLNPGSSVNNPIDFLATGTAEQLGIIIDYCEHKFHEIDAMIVVFGSPGLFDVENVYNVLSVKLEVCKKRIYPVLPSVINAQKEIQGFLDQGNINFPDEVVLGKALTSIHKQTPTVPAEIPVDFDFDRKQLKTLLDKSPKGFLSSETNHLLLDLIHFPRVDEIVISHAEEIDQLSSVFSYPLAMKVQGPVHKTEIGGVVLNINSVTELKNTFSDFAQLNGVSGVVVQPMIRGVELFIGVKKERPFGHLIFCGLGGIFIEVMNDFSTELCPVSMTDALTMIKRLKSYRIIQGYRGKPGVDEHYFAELIVRISKLVEVVPEIEELDLNPLMATGNQIKAVDVRIRIEKDGE